MPRGVYKRKKRASKHDAPATQITLDLPAVTIERLHAYAIKQDKPWDQLVRKAIYDLIPVEYEVDRQFVFPFGKYVGETAGMVGDMDPGYLDWCCKTIRGFKLKGIVTKSEFVTQAYLHALLKPDESIRINKYAAWAHDRITDRWRKLATRLVVDSDDWRLVSK
jgi:hypothetical protein